jgi:hypothetical protein
VGGFYYNEGIGAAWVFAAAWAQQGIKLVGTGASACLTFGQFASIGNDTGHARSRAIAARAMPSYRGRSSPIMAMCVIASASSRSRRGLEGAGRSLLPEPDI